MSELLSQFVLQMRKFIAVYLAVLWTREIDCYHYNYSKNKQERMIKKNTKRLDLSIFNEELLDLHNNKKKERGWGTTEEVN